MQIVTSADFEAEVLKSKIPVLVDFFAVWCGPCKQLAPILEAIAKEKAGKLKIVKVDVDESPELAAQYLVQSMPTLMIVRDGDVIAKESGAAPKSEVTKWINESLALPAGTKLDLAPKPVVLSDNDKVRLRDLFNEVVKALDTPKTTKEGAAMREELKATLASGEIFKQVEAVLTSTAGVLTLDAYIDGTREFFKIPKKGPKL